jgi:putative ABC transport system substrate-binding protein
MADNDELPALIAGVLRRRVDVLVVYGSEAAAAAKNATSTTPVVDAVMSDPVRSGLVASLARPGGNLTGLSAGFAEGMAGKWLELLQETVPRFSGVAVIANPDNPATRELAKELQTLATTRG